MRTDTQVRSLGAIVHYERNGFHELANRTPKLGRKEQEHEER